MNLLQCAPFVGLLSEFAAGMPESEGPLVQIQGAEIPEPQRSLLVHSRDMTSTLERHWREPISLHVLTSRFESEFYARQVVLLTAHTARPVEFGVIRIRLPLLGEKARIDVLAGKVPLGGILNGHGLVYRSCPGGFFRLRSNLHIEKALALSASTSLYGRCNCLSDSEGRTIAEVVEILTPDSCEEKSNEKL